MSMLGLLQLSAPTSSRRHHRDPPQRRLTTAVTRCKELRNQTDRFFTSLAAAAAGGDAAGDTKRLIRKFVSSSRKSIALNALSHVLSPKKTAKHDLSSFALPLYSRITKAPWFDWEPELAAELIALLEKQGLRHESQTLISDAISRIGQNERDLTHFYSRLIDFQSKHKSKLGFDDSCARLTQLLHEGESDHVKRQAFESLVGGLCRTGRPSEAEKLIGEFRVKGLGPSVTQLRRLVQAYGKLGCLDDMMRIVQEIEASGFPLDTICSNMVLSSFGDFPRMLGWVRKMRESSIPISVFTYNAVLQSCPTIMSLLGDLDEIPVSTGDLLRALEGNEALVVRELMGSSVMEGATEWGVSGVKLDLHGMGVGCAYLVMLEWMEELRLRINGGYWAVPAEVTVVCGWGRHSGVRGESPVKKMVRKLMVRTGSPMRVDHRRNLGCFVANGKAVKSWLQNSPCTIQNVPN